MIFGWWADRRRKKLLSDPAPDWYDGLLRERVWFFGLLTEEQRGRLVDISRVLIDEKRWEPCGGLEAIDDELKLLIAVQAALLLLEQDHDYFADVKSVLVYPAVVTVQADRGMVRTELHAAGQAHPFGTILLAVDSVEVGLRRDHDGRNVVLHEFAHALDFLDHEADGTPPLSSRAAYREWVEVMTEHYAALVEAAEDGRRTLLDTYGATNPAEFFAVSTEAFFEKPELLKRAHPELYRVLGSYYRQDPAAWK